MRWRQRDVPWEGGQQSSFEGPPSQDEAGGRLQRVLNRRSKVEQPQDMVTGNPTVVRLVVRFYRNGRGQSALREILGKVIQDTLEDRLLSVHTDPVHVYKSWVNQTEAQTGQRRCAGAWAARAWGGGV